MTWVDKNVSAPMYRSITHWVSSSYDRTSAGSRVSHLFVREEMTKLPNGKDQMLAFTACGLSIRGGRAGKSLRFTSDPQGKMCGECRQIRSGA